MKVRLQIGLSWVGAYLNVKFFFFFLVPQGIPPLQSVNQVPYDTTRLPIPTYFWRHSRKCLVHIGGVYP